MNNFKKMTDDELVTLYMQGNNAAFDTLLKKYQDRVFTYILCKVKDEELANDIFQDTFLKIISSLHNGKYSGNGLFFSWTIRIAHNLIMDRFREVKSAATVVSEGEVQTSELDTACYSEVNRENELIREQNIKDIHKLIDMLPQEQRSVVYMRYFQQLSFKEISEDTGVNINTALGRMRYALLNMRKLVDAKNINLNSGSTL
jgi:RNA polymerase sigma-70 factor (ECF subfamily)